MSRGWLQAWQMCYRVWKASYVVGEKCCTSHADIDNWLLSFQMCTLPTHWGQKHMYWKESHWSWTVALWLLWWVQVELERAPLCSYLLASMRFVQQAFGVCWSPQAAFSLQSCLLLLPSTSYVHLPSTVCSDGFTLSLSICFVVLCPISGKLSEVFESGMK